MNIALPSVILNFETKGKNKIRHFFSGPLEIPAVITETGSGVSVIAHNGLKYAFTKNPAFTSNNFDYVLHTNLAPTQNNFDNGKIVVKKWLKHPLLKEFSADEVLESWGNAFTYKNENIGKKINGLRQPQLAALHSIIGHLILPLETATVVMPTGTGKTETMLSALIANQCSKLLVTVPSDSLREQIGEKFSSLGLLKQFGMVNETARFPIVGIIKEKFDSIDELRDFWSSCNVIITTMSWLTSQDSGTQDTIAQLCSHVFIDEAHHVKATTWNEFKNRFPKEKVVQFTATPFRNDGKRLDGKIIFNFPLRKAQEQGYYKHIEFIPVREYDNSKGDNKIAELAVERLRQDLSQGFNHILMARCETKERAREVFKLYESYTDLNPVILYSGSPNAKDTYQKIIKKQARIIVCVDMLGEGFDLPELKIAAFHDIRRSLPITLQLAGRFTRTKFDEELGNASFIANIANLEVRSELSDLYATDADWNEILSNTSHERISDEVEFKNFMEGFKHLSDATIPFQNIEPKLSTVVYRNKTSEWFPTNFKNGFAGYDDFDFKFSDINREQQILVVIVGKKTDVDWVHHKEIYNVQWDIYVIYWETRNNLLFINSSDNSSLYPELAEAIIGKNAELIRGIDVFKTFHNVKRVKLQNVGLRQFLGKNIRFRMMVGSDVGEALSLAEKQRGEKAFVMGTGYEDGNQVNLGASYKGRIWAKLKGNLKDFRKWAQQLGDKLVNGAIDPNQILKETLIPALIGEIPDLYPVWIDWDVDMYLETESKFKFTIDGIVTDLSGIDIILERPQPKGPLLFKISTDTQEALFELELFYNTSSEDTEAFPDFRVVQHSKEQISIQHGAKQYTGEQFFETFIPTIWFADGSALTGNEYIELKQTIGLYSKEAIIAWDWNGINLKKESQHVTPKVADSIQFSTIQRLLEENWDFIYDDDYSGEIADVIAIKVETEKVVVRLYHLKFALDGVVSNQIKNLYEVCGQAQKSIHWKHKGGKEFINHLLRREKKTRKGVSCSRLEKGSIMDLQKLLSIMKNEIPVEFQIYIVQPGFSKEKVSDEILRLLGVTETYIKEFAAIDLKVIASS